MRFPTSRVLPALLTLAVACTTEVERAASGEGGDAGDLPDGGGASTDGAVDPSAVLYAPDHVVEVEIEIDEADWDELRHQTRDLFDLLEGDCTAEPFESPFTYFPARVIVDGESLEPVGVRKKGFLGSLDENKPALRIAFDEYFAEQQAFGVSTLVLNNSRQDASYLHQCLSYALFSAAGLPAPRCNFAHVVVNGRDLGVYVNVERTGKPLLRRHFASDEGNLYEGTLSDFRPDLVRTFDKKTNEDDPDRSDLEAVVAALEVGDAALLDALEPVIDIDQFVRFWAMEGLVRHWDGYASNRNNFFVYADPTTGRFSFLPWGTDGALEQVDAPGPAVGTTAYLARRLYELDASRIGDELRNVLDDVWNEDELLAEVDRMAALVEPFAFAAGVAGLQELDDALWNLRGFIAGRRAAIEAELRTSLPPLTEPSADVPCIEVLGSAGGTFDTTFGTIGSDNPFAAGSGTIELDVALDDGAATTGPVGSMAGWDEEMPVDPNALVMTLSALDDGDYLLVGLSVPADLFTPSEWPLGWGPVAGGLWRWSPATQTAEPIGWLFGGTLTLDEAATTSGSPVRGSFDAMVISF